METFYRDVHWYCKSRNPRYPGRGTKTFGWGLEEWEIWVLKFDVWFGPMSYLSLYFFRCEGEGPSKAGLVCEWNYFHSWRKMDELLPYLMLLSSSHIGLWSFWLFSSFIMSLYLMTFGYAILSSWIDLPSFLSVTIFSCPLSVRCHLLREALPIALCKVFYFPHSTLQHSIWWTPGTYKNWSCLCTCLLCIFPL